jgi:hypothetical protein
MEENVELLDAKINEQDQTKVESGSKYRVRLSGIVLLNLFENRGGVDNLDFPELAMSPDTGAPAGTFGGSLRQSQISLQAFGPDVTGAHTSADVTFDFAGGFPNYSNGQVMGLVRLRTGTLRMDWADTSLVAGQDRLFFARLDRSPRARLQRKLVGLDAASPSRTHRSRFGRFQSHRARRNSGFLGRRSAGL